MEETKKRWRPTLTAYREQEEVIHRQCVELDAWREKYRELVKCKEAGAYQELNGKYREQLTFSEHLGKRLDELKSENASLSQSNKLMEMELRKVQSELDFEREVSRVKAAECENLRNRGFWARVFNR